MKSGPIIIIEDDLDDREMMDEILKELNVENEVVWFTNSKDAFAHLKTTSEQPFLIMCDVNLPGENGIDFKWRVDADPQLRKKSIPFVFYSTAVNQQAVNDAYTKMTVQGFFKKSSSYEEAKSHIKMIHDYWKICTHPNTF